MEKINKSVSSNLKKDFDDEEASSKGTKRIRMSDLVGDCPVDAYAEALMRELFRPIQRNLSIEVTINIDEYYDTIRCASHGICSK